jgi:hypothetical protein
MTTDSCNTASLDKNHPNPPTEQTETLNNHEEVDEHKGNKIDGLDGTYFAQISLYYIALQTCDIRLYYCTEKNKLTSRRTHQR